MKVLVTRPKLFAEPLCESIRQWGAAPILYPTIEIIEHKVKAIPDYLHKRNELEQAHRVIFTSRFAVHYGVSILKSVLDNRSQDQPALQVIALGAGTQQELFKAGIQEVHCSAPPFESESLLQHPLLQNIKDQKITLFCGKHPRDLLPQTLLNRGAMLSIFEVYRRALPSPLLENPLSPNNENFPEVIITTSLEALKNLKILTMEGVWSRLMKQTFILVGLRMNEFAANLGIDRRILSAGANDVHLLQSLERVGDF